MTPPRSAFGLLVFLSSFGGCPVAREQVIEALWPETSPDKASSCLTSSLHRLRKFLREIGHNHAVLVMPGGALALALSEKLSLDTALFAHAAQKFLADDTARALPTGMPQDLRSAAPFQGWYAPWALRERARLELLYERCLRVHMQRQIADGAKEAALDTGARLLDHDPLLEDVHEDVIDIHLSQDRRALALRQYQCCAETLRRELDVAPSQRLAAKLRAACGRSDLLAGTCWDQRSDLALGA
ncbi:MAG: AfsR/SARP family transcriptional regulator [Mangrovicoccus sp.]